MGAYGIAEILQIYDTTHTKADGDGDGPKVGQIVRTVVPQYGDRWRIFDAVRSDSANHTSVSGTLRDAQEADFKPKQRLPIKLVSLGDCEELLALKAKLRPCVVLAVSPGVAPHTISDVSQRNVAQNVLRPACLVAPAFTVAIPGETKPFGPIMSARVQCMVYPEFVWLPASGGVIKYDSVVRLDRAFWSTLPPPTVMEPLSLHQEMLAVIDNQLAVLRGLDPSADYKSAVSLLQEQLPKFAMPRATN